MAHVHIRLIHPSPVEFVHKIVVHRPRVYPSVLKIIAFGAYRHEPVCKALKLEILLQSDHIFSSAAHEVNRSIPVIARKQVKHHHLVLHKVICTYLPVHRFNYLIPEFRRHRTVSGHLAGINPYPEFLCWNIVYLPPPAHPELAPVRVIGNEIDHLPYIYVVVEPFHHVDKVVGAVNIFVRRQRKRHGR